MKEIVSLNVIENNRNLHDYKRTIKLLFLRTITCLINIILLFYLDVQKKGTICNVQYARERLYATLSV